MAYTVNKRDGSLLVVIPDGIVDNTATSISLLGKGFNNYGEIVAEDWVHMLENFASGMKPSRPLKGQLWYDTSNNCLKVNTGTQTDDNWLCFANESVGWIPAKINNINVLVLFIEDEILGIWTKDDISIPLSFTDSPTQLTDTMLDPFETTQTGRPDAGLKRGLNLNPSNNTLLYGDSSSSFYADIAERYAADGPTAPGDLVSLGGEAEIKLTSTEKDINVFGVVSTNPAIKLNIDAGNDQTHPFVAMTGRVPCKVIGPVRKGQRLVSSHVMGVAKALDDLEASSCLLAIFGRALEDNTDPEIKLVEVTVGAK